MSGSSPTIAMSTINFNGTVEYNASAAQTLVAATGGGASPNTYTNLELSGVSAKTLSQNTAVNGTLTLTSGLLTLGANNLTLGASASVSGTPSASNMIVTDSTGELCKAYSGAGSFTFPVGDNTGTADYSPATLNFTSGMFSSGRACVNVTDAKHSSNTSTTDYLTRYWTVSQSGITDFSCATTFNYVAADVAGTEGNIYTSKLDGTTWTLLNVADTANNTIGGTVNSFSDFTGGEQTPMAVNLASFTAEATADGVMLAWETVSEVDNAGFNVYRADSDADSWVRLNDTLIPTAAPGSSEGHAYIWLDVYATPNVAYTYMLEDVALDGTVTRHPPVTTALKPAAAPNAVGLATFRATTSRPALAGLVAFVIVTTSAVLAGRRRKHE